MPRVLLATESLLPGNGGICRVARLTARVLGELSAAGELSAQALALDDPTPSKGLGLAASTARGSRLDYVARVHVAAATRSHFLYDFLGVARAHPRLPFARRPFATWLHGIEVWEHTRPDRLAAAARAAMLFCNTEYTRARADRVHGGFARARVCWLATESDTPGPPRPHAPDPPTVLILARLSLEEARKGHAELIDCWPRVTARLPEARLMIVGNGTARADLEARARTSPAAAQIQFRGFVPDEALPAVWAETSVLAMPSRGEGFGMVYVEAMQWAVPVIASVHDAAPEINLDGETGYNVNLDRPDELPERLLALLLDPGLAATMGRNGQRRWAKHFRYNAFKRRFVPLLEEFLAL